MGIKQNNMSESENIRIEHLEVRVAAAMVEILSVLRRPDNQNDAEFVMEKKDRNFKLK